jgi:hypothetical protein
MALPHVLKSLMHVYSPPALRYYLVKIALWLFILELLRGDKSDVIGEYSPRVIEWDNSIGLGAWSRVSSRSHAQLVVIYIIPTTFKGVSSDALINEAEESKV